MDNIEETLNLTDAIIEELKTDQDKYAFKLIGITITFDLLK